MRPIELVLSKLPTAKKSRGGWDAPCPAHKDERPSLRVSEGDDGCVLLKCFAGCTAKAICDAIDLKLSDLFVKRAKGNRSMKGKKQREIVSQYDYHDANGQLVFQVVRVKPKDFFQCRPDGNGGWIPNMDGVQRILYQLPQILAASVDTIVFIVEGEKDVDRLRDCGCMATCNPGGAGKWSQVDDSPLHGRIVVIIVDNDEVGRKHGREVAKSLLGKAREIRIVELPDVPPKGDVSDFLEKHTVEELHAHVAQVEPITEANTVDVDTPPNDGDSKSVMLTYTLIDKDADQRAEIVVRKNGEPIERSKVNLSSDRARTRFAKQLLQKTNAFTEAEIESKLLRFADEIQAERRRRLREGSQPTPDPPATANVQPMTVDGAREVFSKWLTLKDWTILDVVFGTVLVHRLEGDPLWTWIVGPPGAVKTEILRSLSPHPEIFSVSTLSPAALISGYITDGPDPSLLPKLNGKVLVVKDFTTILQMQRDARGEVISTLRDVYDGEACKVFGTGEQKSYKSRFGLLAAVTPVIDDYSSVNAQLGERFLRYRLDADDSLIKIAKALDNATAENTMRDELRRAAHRVLALKPVTPTIAPNILVRLTHLANFLATARSEVARDRDGTVTYVPVPEVGTRVAKQLKKLTLGVAMARGLVEVNEAVYRIAVCVALDSLPSMRKRLLAALWDWRGAMELTATIADACEFDTETCRTWLADLRLLGIVDRRIADKNAHSWQLRESTIQDIQAAQIWTNGEIVSSPPDAAPDALPADPTTVGCKVGGGAYELLDCGLVDEVERAERDAIQAIEAEQEKNDEPSGEAA